MRRRSWVLLGFLVGVTACGAKSPPPATAPEEPQPAPAPRFAAPPPPAQEAAEAESDESLDAGKGRGALELAEADLERARAEFDGLVPPARHEGPAAAGAPAPARSRATEGAGEHDAPRSKPAEKAEKKAADNGCVTACRAFASLDRAASAVCRLAGETDARCTRAKGIVTDARQRVTSCGCRTE